MVRLRLQRKGRRKRPFYHIVAADQRAPRDGRYIERIGSYNPMTKPATIEIDRDKAFDWLNKGAQPSDTVRAILRVKGVYYRKHLMRGVAKGMFTEEEAMAKYEEWIAAKEAKIQARKEETDRELAAWHAKRNGTPPPPPAPVVEETPAEEESETPVENTEEETAPVAEAAEEAAPAEENKDENA